MVRQSAVEWFQWSLRHGPRRSWQRLLREHGGAVEGTEGEGLLPGGNDRDHAEWPRGILGISLDFMICGRFQNFQWWFIDVLSKEVGKQEVGKQSSELRTNRILRLYSMNGGMWAYITEPWEVWGYTQWRVVCDVTSHNNEKCETILKERWYVSLHNRTMRSVRLYSRNGGMWVYIT